MTTDATVYARSILVEESQALEDSIEIVRLKRDRDEAVVAARFENRSGRQVRAMVGLREVDGAWHGTGGFTLGASRVGGTDTAWRTGGWSRSGRGGVRGFWVAYPGVVSVRLTEPGGRAQQDHVEGGAAVFMWAGDFDDSGAGVELLGSEGDVLKRGPVWPAPSLDG